MSRTTEAEIDSIVHPITQWERDDFWYKVDVGLSDECWPWRRSISREGYGNAWFRKAMMRAHRVAYFLYYNHWPMEMCLHKSTCKRSCCNPLHLREGDYRDNYSDPPSPYKYPGWNKFKRDWYNLRRRRRHT